MQLTQFPELGVRSDYHFRLCGVRKDQKTSQAACQQSIDKDFCGKRF